MSIFTSQIELLCEEKDDMAMFANLSACIHENFDRLNWAGFYLLKNDELVLGPFQGKVACTHISIGKGVCGTCALNKESILVPDVHQFPGHIACDSASNSEIVIPIMKNDQFFGLIDMDSPFLNRFTSEDQRELEKAAEIISDRIMQ